MLIPSRKAWPSPFLFGALWALLLAAGRAFAGDGFAPAPQTAPDSSHCDALGEGYLAVSGSNACIKISGYVSAGGDVSTMVVDGAQGAGPFAPKSGAGIDAHSAQGAETPLGPGRLYVQIGHNAYGQ